MFVPRTSFTNHHEVPIGQHIKQTGYLRSNLSHWTLLKRRRCLQRNHLIYPGTRATCRATSKIDPKRPNNTFLVQTGCSEQMKQWVYTCIWRGHRLYINAFTGWRPSNSYADPGLAGQDNPGLALTWTSQGWSIFCQHHPVQAFYVQWIGNIREQHHRTSMVYQPPLAMNNFYWRIVVRGMISYQRKCARCEGVFLLGAVTATFSCEASEHRTKKLVHKLPQCSRHQKVLCQKGTPRMIGY